MKAPLFKIRYTSVSGFTMYVRDMPYEEDLGDGPELHVEGSTSDTAANIFVRADADAALALVRKIDPKAEIIADK